MPSARKVPRLLTCLLILLVTISFLFVFLIAVCSVAISFVAVSFFLTTVLRLHLVESAVA